MCQTAWFKEKVKASFLKTTLESLDVDSLEDLFALIDPIIEKMLYLRKMELYSSLE